MVQNEKRLEDALQSAPLAAPQTPQQTQTHFTYTPSKGRFSNTSSVVGRVGKVKHQLREHLVTRASARALGAFSSIPALLPAPCVMLDALLNLSRAVGTAGLAAARHTQRLRTDQSQTPQRDLPQMGPGDFWGAKTPSTGQCPPIAAAPQQR